jgi:multicomponent K+:H+ antiporter subunit G
MTGLPFWLDALLAGLVLTGAGFALVGSWGLAKLSDVLKRLHGPTKASTLGVGCLLIASSLWFSVMHGAVSLHELLITGFVFMTAPVSAHLLVKAALRMDPALRPPPPPAAPAPDGGEGVGAAAPAARRDPAAPPG